MSPATLSQKAIAASERLILALDVPDVDKAKALVDELGDSVRFYKVGLELFMTGEVFRLSDWLRGRGKKIFFDLKFFDIPNTVRSAVRQLRSRGGTFVTVHGNDEILKAAAEEKGDTKVLAVTALTSLDEGDLRDLGFKVDTETLVLSRARRALELGCDGVISSGMEVRALREKIDDKLFIVVPGIRPVENREADDQKRALDVEDAFARGADYIVIGRPIRNAPQPRQAAEAIQQRIAKLFA
jgi:orotidine-5'-phosphate decarboxylase